MSNPTETIAQLTIGQIAVMSEMLNIMIDKGIVTQDEARRRFERLKRDLGRSCATEAAYHGVFAMLAYLDSRAAEPGERSGSH